ncbi:MAG: recombinase family protein [Alphaproteobacteria bacterium]
MGKLRCAIYTRKSTDEGLEMEFNTLDAQREAGENYILSQRHEGWSIIPTRYDDGGYSGGNTNRPAFKKLMADVESGFIDMIVVYKIDRLTRSLTDFSRMVEIFDKHNVSFVSVTQQFNTSTSMGRLTLNMLLSFAQFEREVSGERIRDKFAASKQKGMFMGGMPVLGYDIKNRKLIMNNKETKIIRKIFECYLECQSYQKTARYINALGYRTKKWTSANGVEYGGKAFYTGMIYNILRNPLYIGKIKHKDKEYDGLHAPIIDKESWEKVREIIKTPYAQRNIIKTGQEEPMLKGLIHCGCCGSAMIHSHTKRGNIHYRYYVSINANKRGYENCEIGCIPAEKIEGLVVEQIKNLIKSPEVISRTYKETLSLYRKTDEKVFISRMKSFESVWEYLYPGEINQIVRSLLNKVTIYTDKIEIKLDIAGLFSKLKEFEAC